MAEPATHAERAVLPAAHLYAAVRAQVAALHADVIALVQRG